MPLGCSASRRICSRGVEFFVCVVSKTCQLSLILPCVMQMINDTLNNEVTCILEKQTIFLTRVTILYTADSLNSINGIKNVQYEEKRALNFIAQTSSEDSSTRNCLISMECEDCCVQNRSHQSHTLTYLNPHHSPISYSRPIL